MTKIPNDKIDSILVTINNCISIGQLNTKERLAMFLAQTGHESGEYRFKREVWGPSAQQLRYERNATAAWPPTKNDQINKLAFRLGNREKNDGFIFRGWGPLQITGRSNTLKASLFLFQDNRLTINASLLNDIEVGFKGAIWYWQLNDINSLADLKDIKGATKVINGAYNGLKEREQYFNLALKVL